MAQHYVYRFYAELKDYKPKIWRRFEINGEKTIAELGYALMIMFEMQASHLFCFNENVRGASLAALRTQFSEEQIQKVWSKGEWDDFTKNVRYELPFGDSFLGDNERLEVANRIKLQQISRKPGWKLTFEYDYGDGWEVDLELIACEKLEVSLADLPCVNEGEGVGIVEDVGGIPGLEELAKALKKGSGKKYDDFCAWLGSTTLDLEAFNKDDMKFPLEEAHARL
ncbi:MAG: plasmid pRiA4b ORF-3 family protein [Peptococcaceae bacterium]|nr:plasmid pRiA4b ORF-3 family protein [Peptococcaceae bacterium]